MMVEKTFNEDMLDELYLTGRTFDSEIYQHHKEVAESIFKSNPDITSHSTILMTLIELTINTLELNIEYGSGILDSSNLEEVITRVIRYLSFTYYILFTEYIFNGSLELYSYIGDLLVKRYELSNN